MPRRCLLSALSLVILAGCMTTKESDTSRTGVEQLLLSSATDKALDKVDFTPIARAKVFVDTQYLDCTDKNYVIVSLHQHLLRQQCLLVDKKDDADVVVEIGSGGVGTDRTDWFVGIPEIPLAPPSPIMLPKMTLFNRTRAIGTAKLSVVALDVKTHQAVINAGYSLARSDQKDWNVMGMGSTQTGTLPQELAAATGETESMLVPANMAKRAITSTTRK